ncbi:MAG: ShlB/FhaC/HecB family hemolysin secretion/activation protein [Cyanobacteria bacterium P01_D01_bin.1]
MHIGFGRLARSLTVLIILSGSSFLSDDAVAQESVTQASSAIWLSQNAPASELSPPDIELPSLPTPPSDEPVLPPEPSLEPVLPEPVVPPPAGDRAQVMLTDIQVIGSSVFDERDFSPILSAYEGRTLGFRDFQQVADEITRLYVASGYITSRAILGEQTIVDGVVQVRVIEGTLENIQIEGARRLTGYVRDRISLVSRRPLNQSTLESQLQLLRADPLIDKIEASLRAGTGEGQSQLIVRVLPAPLVSGRVTLDTSSPDSVGSVRMGIETDLNNLLGMGDKLSVSAFRSTTGGLNTYGLIYTLPVNSMDGTFQARYLPSTFELTSADLVDLGVTGASDTYEFTYRQPVIRRPDEELAFSAGFRHRTGETLVSDVVIDSTRTSIVQLSQDYLRRDQTGAWGVRSQLDIGTDWFNATDRDDEADGQFVSWSSQVQRAQILNRSNLLLMQGSVQLSTDSLLGADQLIVGGSNSVRGYSQNARFGDNGVRASIENRITVQRSNNGSAALQLAPFLDTAAVWDNDNNTNSQNFLLGTGVGLIANILDDVQTRVDVGIPLVELNEPGDSDQDVFLYFSLGYRF